VTAKLPAISPRSPKSPCDLPAISRETVRDLPAISRETRAKLPHICKHICCVPPSGERHKPIVVADQIEALAARVLRLMVSHRDPEHFFVERSDIAGEMRRLARAVRK